VGAKRVAAKKNTGRPNSAGTRTGDSIVYLGNLITPFLCRAYPHFGFAALLTCREKFKTAKPWYELRAYLFSLSAGVTA
jgi:hypothetical protein